MEGGKAEYKGQLVVAIHWNRVYDKKDHGGRPEMGWIVHRRKK
jgi:hypothetical protein